MLSTLRSWFDPTERHQVGNRPDYRYSLANERTFLAWMRTGLALIGGGLAVAQFLSGAITSDVLATVLLCIGGVVAIRAVDHWARAERAIRLDEELPTSRFPAILALLIAFGAGALVAVVLLGAVGQ